MCGQGFEEIEHTADVALRVWGADLASLFASAAHGLAWLLADPTGVAPLQQEVLTLEAIDAETLLVTWLGELLYLCEREGCVWTEFELQQVTPTRLCAVVRGGAPLERRRSIKAVTFNDLQIVRSAAGYSTTVVFDV